MKPLLSLSFLLLFAVPKSYGQNVDNAIQKKWGLLNTHLKFKAKKVVELSKALIEADTTKELLYIETKFIASELYGYLDTLKTIDSKAIKIVSKKNDNLTNVLMKILMLVQDRKNSNAVALFFIYMPQLKGAEERIELAKDNYNKTCKANKRKDWMFIDPTPEKDVKVKF
jgi:hypothetical protein